MDHQIFRRAAVLEAVAEVDLDAADRADALDPRQFRLALLQRAMGLVAFARDLFQVLPQPFGGTVSGKGSFKALAGVMRERTWPDRYSHRRSVMAMCSKGIWKERRRRMQ